MIKYFENKKIVIGVTGSIAAYKSVDIASQLTQRGAIVDVIMTEKATKFVSPLSFQAITHRKVVVDLYDPASDMGMDHLVLANQADLFVIAPATANIVSKTALGISDNSLTATLLATEAPILICPAMDGDMFQKPQVKTNLDKLIEYGFHVLGPDEGRLASGKVGKGRLVESSEILDMCRYILGIHGDYEGKTITDPDIRSLFDPGKVLQQSWYKERLVLKQEKDFRYFTRQYEYIEDYLSKDTHKAEAGRLGLQERLSEVKSQLEIIKSSDYLKSLEGTIGCDVALKNNS